MDHRMHRQQLLVPQGMKEATVLLVGLGMLGSWTAHVLARTCGAVVGFDHDTVGVENLGTQAYNDLSIDLPKADMMDRALVGLPFTAQPVRFNPDIHNWSPGGIGPLVVVSCVDSFAVRRQLAEWAAKHADLFIDTRAAGTVGVVVVCPADKDFVEHHEAYEFSGPVIAQYLRTLESDEDAPVPSCGAEGCAMVGLWVASQVASAMTRYFRGLPVPYKIVRDVAMDEEILREEVPMVQV